VDAVGHELLAVAKHLNFAVKSGGHPLARLAVGGAVYQCKPARVATAPDQFVLREMSTSGGYDPLHDVRVIDIYVDTPQAGGQEARAELVLLDG
jgi:hypothetical protein